MSMMSVSFLRRRILLFEAIHRLLNCRSKIQFYCYRDQFPCYQWQRRKNVDDELRQIEILKGNQCLELKNHS